MRIAHRNITNYRSDNKAAENDLKFMTDKKINRSGGKLLLGHLGALLTMGAWGSSFVFTKVLLEDGGFSPVETYTYRFALAYLLLLLISFRKIFANSLRDEVAFFICGICSGSLYYILENFALERTSTGNVSLLASVSPLFTTILMAVVYRQKIRVPIIVGSVLALFGVGCVIMNKGEGFTISPAGDLLALSASLAWAVYTIVVKRLLPVYNGIFITRKLFFYGVITSIPLLFIKGGASHLHLLFDLSHPEYLLNILFLVVMCSVLGFLVWNEVMRLLGPVTANNYIYMQPMVTLVVAYFVLDEQIYLMGYLGCVLIIGGLIIADKWNPKGKLRAD